MTSILNIYIDGITNDGKITNEIEFEPYMLNKDFSNYDYTLFSPSLPITKKDIPKNLNNEEKMKIFFSLDLFQKLLEKIKQQKNILQIPTNFNVSYIENNIDMILNILFYNGQHITIGNDLFTIYTHTWNGKYTTNNQNNKITIFNINVRLVLQKGESISFYESLQLSCKEREREIKRNFNDITGIKNYYLDKYVDDITKIPTKQNKDGSLQNENPDILKKINTINKTTPNVQYAGKIKNKK